MKTLSSFLRKKMILPFFFFWTITILILFVISFSFFLKLEEQRKNMILLSTDESLKNPIALGAFVEIKSRLYSLNKEYVDYCLDFKSSDFYTDNCNKFHNRNLISIYEMNKSNSGMDYTIVMYYSKISFITYALKVFTLIFFLMLLVGVWFFKRVNLVAKSINDESGSIFKVEEENFRFQILEFHLLKKQYRDYLTIKSDVIELEARSSLARQVSHDIRSPLSALDMILEDIEAISFEKKSLFKSAINRIQDISNDLLNKSLNDKNRSAKVEMLSSVVELIFSEKRIEFRKNFNFKLDLDLDRSYGLFSEIKSYELKTIISNLINNSIEASRDNNDISVIVRLFDDHMYNIIEITDNGIGIDKETLSLLGREIISNKDNGNGIGFYNAKSLINGYGGDLIVKSIVGEGTSVFIKLKKAVPPAWFVESFNLNNDVRVICIDDDISILELWKQKLKNIKNLEQYTSFSNIPLIETDNVMYLVDYEILSSNVNGIDFIINSGILSNSILVTSRFEEELVKEKVESYNLRMIPKNMIRQVPINLLDHNSINSLSDILIDNDELVRVTWELSAKRYKKNLIALEKIEDFNKIKEKLSFEVNIYIDEELGNNVKGRDVAKIIYEQGFKNIYITSGHSKDFFGDVKNLKGIISKAPPFK